MQLSQHVKEPTTVLAGAFELGCDLSAWVFALTADIATTTTKGVSDGRSKGEEW